MGRVGSGRAGSVVAAVLLLGVPAATAACSDGGGSPVVPTGRSGDPGDTASPTGPSPTPTPTPPPLTPTDAATSPSSPPASGSAAGTDLPGCLVGTWTAPLGREFDHLALSDRSGGTVRGGTGTLRLRFGADGRWTLTYEQVRLNLLAGSADVSGPVEGTWSLAGSTLTADVTGDRLSARMSLGGVSTTTAPGTVTGALRALTPTGASVTCTGDGLRFRLPTSEGGGTATFDQAR